MFNSNFFKNSDFFKNIPAFKNSNFVAVFELSIFVGKIMAFIVVLMFISMGIVYAIFGEDKFNELAEKYEGIISRVKDVLIKLGTKHSTQSIQSEMMGIYIKCWILNMFYKIRNIL